MSVEDDFLNEIEKYLNRVSPLTPLNKPTLVNPKFYFKIKPNHFMKWLKSEGMEVTGNYKEDCSSMCEYACLYISMLLYDKQLEGELKVVCGNYGWWEHYWMKYTVNGVTYFIDLTLKQFISEAPKLSISFEVEDEKGYTSKFDPTGQDYKKYVDEKMGFEFYNNPSEI